ncbi:MAG: YlzJ-like family protein [Clostridium sp.]|nr:YlzJ-like family protein [Clostridium sp.]
MLWTIVPLEVVLEGSESFQPAYTEIIRNNTRLVVEELGKNSAKIIRVISSNPIDYLNPAIQPGNIILMNNKLKQPAQF